MKGKKTEAFSLPQTLVDRKALNIETWQCTKGDPDQGVFPQLQVWRRAGTEARSFCQPFPQPEPDQDLQAGLHHTKAEIVKEGGVSMENSTKCTQLHSPGLGSQPLTTRQTCSKLASTHLPSGFFFFFPWVVKWPEYMKIFTLELQTISPTRTQWKNTF